MKINLNFRTANSLRHEFASKLLEQFAAEFCEDHDIYPAQTTVADLKDYARLLPLLIDWAVSKGWKLTTWELRRPYGDNNLFAYGLEFDDSCPLFMEARLKYS